MTARLLLEYDGGGFAGWARQPGLRTVEAVVEDAIATITGSPVTVTVAGRTDAGVHARGQVASHEGSPIAAHRLNGVLPRDVRVLASDVAEDGFDARGDARSRIYRYRVLNRVPASPFEQGRALHIRYGLDRGLLDQCAALVVGTHDFTAFTPTQTEHVRFDRHVMRCDWSPEEGDVLAMWIEADAFMRHMVRTLVGSMIAVANRRLSLEWFAGLLEGRPRAEAGDTAAPHGLYLERVTF